MARQKVLALANKISNKKMTAKNAVKENDPEYKILAPVVTDDMADAAMHLAFREPRSAVEVAALCGKPEDETSRLLWELSMAGVSFVNEIDGIDKYWHDSWVPGVMEMMVNNKENEKNIHRLQRPLKSMAEQEALWLPAISR